MGTIRITEIKQLEPIAPILASVQIHFVVLGVLPDIVQIYANAGNNQAEHKINIEITPPENKYDCILELQAGAIYNITFCPRTVTNGVLDDSIDGQYWESLCVSMSFTTISNSSLTPAEELSPPIITTIESHQATLNDEGYLDIQWSSFKRDKYHFMWMLKPRNGWAQIEIEAKSHRVIPTFPGQEYSLKVQGCNSMLIGHDNCSDFSVTRNFTIPQNTSSLRQFLSLSNAQLNPGIQSLGSATYSSGIRAMMHL